MNICSKGTILIVVRSDKTASAVPYDVVAIRFTLRNAKMAAAATVQIEKKKNNM